MIQEIQEKHTFCAQDYKAQIQFLEAQYLLEKELAFNAEEARRKKLFEGPKGDANAKVSAEFKFPEYKHLPAKTYRSRTELLIDCLEEDFLDREDHAIQLPWAPEQMPTTEEMKKRNDMRRE